MKKTAIKITTICLLAFTNVKAQETMEPSPKLDESKNLYGYVDMNDKYVIPAKYNEASPFTNGFAIVTKNIGKEETRKSGLINLAGKEIIPIKYEWMYDYLNEGVVAFGDYQPNGNASLGLMDTNGKILIQPQYENNYTGAYSDMWICVNKQKKFGVVSFKNEPLVPFEYDELRDYNKTLNVFDAIKDKKQGFVDNKGHVIIPFDYDSGFSQGNYYVLCKGGLFGVLNKDKKIIVPFEYSKVESTWSDLALVRDANNVLYEVNLITGKKTKK